MQIININKTNKQKLNALLFWPEMPCHHVIIICHGFRGRKENSGKIFSFSERLNEIGFGVLAFDFSGSGDSDGEFSNVTLTGQAEDLACVINYVYMSYKLPIILLGRSFGGSTVLAGGSGNKHIAGYILWSAPVYLHETFAGIMKEFYDKLKVGQTVLIRDDAGEFLLEPAIIQDFDLHNMPEYFERIGDKPVLTVQGQADEVVAPCNAEHMSKHIKNCNLELIEGADHRFENKTREREDITLKWLKKLFCKMNE